MRTVLRRTCVAYVGGTLTKVTQIVYAGAASLWFAGLSGCVGMTDETLDAALTDPTKYALYDCRDLDRAISSTMIRLTELEQLIARASQGPGGAVMSAIAYNAELRQGRGQLKALKALSAEKQCVANNEYLSRRSLY
jgi:hypothetical protein